MPPAGYRDTFAAARDVGALSDELARRMAPSAGLRNILVHQYLDADLTIVADAVGRAVVDYAEYVSQVATWLTYRRDVADEP